MQQKEVDKLRARHNTRSRQRGGMQTRQREVTMSNCVGTLQDFPAVQCLLYAYIVESLQIMDYWSYVKAACGQRLPAGGFGPARVFLPEAAAAE